MNTKLIYVTGPSGAGKSFLLTAIRGAAKLGRPDDTLTLDLDLVGYRRQGDPDATWHVSPDIFKLMAGNAKGAQKSAVLAGCDSNPGGMVAAARTAGFEVCALIPSAVEITAHRRMRGDKPAKVMAAGSDWARWMQLARVLNTTVYTDGATLLSSFGKELHNVR